MSEAYIHNYLRSKLNRDLDYTVTITHKYWDTKVDVHVHVPIIVNTDVKHIEVNGSITTSKEMVDESELDYLISYLEMKIARDIIREPGTN